MSQPTMGTDTPLLPARRQVPWSTCFPPGGVAQVPTLTTFWKVQLQVNLGGPLLRGPLCDLCYYHRVPPWECALPRYGRASCSYWKQGSSRGANTKTPIFGPVLMLWGPPCKGQVGYRVGLWLCVGDHPGAHPCWMVGWSDRQYGHGKFLTFFLLVVGKSDSGVISLGALYLRSWTPNLNALCRGHQEHHPPQSLWRV